MLSNACTARPTVRFKDDGNGLILSRLAFGRVIEAIQSAGRAAGPSAVLRLDDLEYEPERRTLVAHGVEARFAGACAGAGRLSLKLTGDGPVYLVAVDHWTRADDDAPGVELLTPSLVLSQNPARAGLELARLTALGERTRLDPRFVPAGDSLDADPNSRRIADELRRLARSFFPAAVPVLENLASSWALALPVVRLAAAHDPASCLARAVDNALLAEPGLRPAGVLRALRAHLAGRLPAEHVVKLRPQGELTLAIARMLRVGAPSRDGDLVRWPLQEALRPGEWLVAQLDDVGAATFGVTCAGAGDVSISTATEGNPVVVARAVRANTPTIEINAPRGADPIVCAAAYTTIPS